MSISAFSNDYFMTTAFHVEAGVGLCVS